MHKNYIMCWFVYLTVPVSTILSFTCKFLCSFILPSHWTALQKYFPSIPTKYPQVYQLPLDCISLGYLQLAFRHSSPPTSVFTILLSLGNKNFKNPPPKKSRDSFLSSNVKSSQLTKIQGLLILKGMNTPFKVTWASRKNQLGFNSNFEEQS